MAIKAPQTNTLFKPSVGIGILDLPLIGKSLILVGPLVNCCPKLTPETSPLTYEQVVLNSLQDVEGACLPYFDRAKNDSAFIEGEMSADRPVSRAYRRTF